METVSHSTSGSVGLAAIAALVTIFVACGSSHGSSPTQICVPEDQQSCICVDGQFGSEQCSDTGTYYEPCDCTSDDGGSEDAGFDATDDADGVDAADDADDLDASDDADGFDASDGSTGEDAGQTCVVPIWATATNSFTGGATSPYAPGDSDECDDDTPCCSGGECVIGMFNPKTQGYCIAACSSNSDCSSGCCDQTQVFCAFGYEGGGCPP